MTRKSHAVTDLRALTPLRLALSVVAFACVLCISAAGQVFDPTKVVKPVEDLGFDATDVEHRTGKLEFEPLHSGGRYTMPLTIENNCPSDQTVSIFVNGLADLKLDISGCNYSGTDRKSCAKIVPPGITEVAGTIETERFVYYVDPMFPNAPRPFKRFSGDIVLFHAATNDCRARRDQYAVQYEVHAMQGYVEPPPPGPEKTVGAGPCQVWWNTGRRPDMLKPEQKCETEIRPLAAGYRERVLPPHITSAPAEWAWLPTPDQIMRMSSEDLVAMKLRAEAQIVR